MRRPLVITLGGCASTIRPLTLGQAEEIEELMSQGLHPVRMGMAIVVAALRRDRPAIRPEDLECDAIELRGAVDAILAMLFEPARPTGGDAGASRPDWPAIRGRLVTSAGVPLDRVDDVEWWRVVELFTFWLDEPPMRDLTEAIARFLGYQPRPKMPSPADNEAAIAAMIRNHPDGRVRHA